MLGDMCYEGKGGDSQNYHAAMHWYLQTSEQGDPEGQRKVGLIMAREFQGSYLGRRLVSRSSRPRNTKAEDRKKIACYYCKGQGASRNYIKVADRRLRLAEQDEAEAQFNLDTSTKLERDRRHCDILGDSI